jgi:hypothetical protein
VDAPQLADLCQRAYDATGNWERQDSRTRWVMDRSWYDRVRAVTVTPEQDRARAAAHATAWMEADPVFPRGCPARCAAGPFTAMSELAGHMAAMSDPLNREPADADRLFGIPVEVRAGGGEPYLETRP